MGGPLPPPRRPTLQPYGGPEERTPLPTSPAARERLIADAAFDALKAVREQSETVGQLVEIIKGTPTKPEQGLLWRVMEQENKQDRKDDEREKRRRFWSQTWITILGGLCLALATWVARLHARFP